MTQVKLPLDQERRQHALDLLAQAVSMDTTNPPGKELELARWVSDYFEGTRCEVSCTEASPGRGNVVVVLPGRGGERLLLNGHLDTVPVGDQSKWTHPPLNLTVEGDCLYGRGTSDMKGGLCALMVALKRVAASGFKPSGDVVLLGTYDEEAGGAGAMAFAAQDTLQRVKGLLIAEPTANRLGIASLGCLWLEVTVKGKSAHAAYPDQGVNAIDLLYHFKEEVNKFMSEQTDPLLGTSTCQLTQLEGGVKANMVPDSARATLDIRTVPSVQQEELISAIAELAKKYSGEEEAAEITIRVINQRSAIAIDKDHPLVVAMGDAHERVLALSPTFAGTRFFSDGSIFDDFLEVPTLLYGPGESEQAHQANEYLNQNNYFTAIGVYEAFIIRFMKGEKA